MLATFMIPVMNVALVVGVGVVLPLSLRAPLRWWLFAGASVALALVLEPGVIASLFVVPWVVLSTLSGVLALRRGTPWLALISGFSGVASLALCASRLELVLFDIREPIVKLTALHFTFAGAGTLALAQRLHDLRPGRWATSARLLVSIAPPVVASGFVFRSAAGQVGGATMMTLGVWLVAALQLPDARTGEPRAWLWWPSILSPLVAMVLGLTWAAHQYFPSVPALTVPDMVPTHGALNAFGFVLCAHLAAWRR